MEPTVDRAALVAVVNRWNRPERAIDAASEAGLIPPAQRHGLGRGRGWEWSYPPGSDRALEHLLRLRARGYRGDALSFAQWWAGHASWSPFVAKYVSSLFAYGETAARSLVGSRGSRTGTALASGDLQFEADDQEATGDLVSVGLNRLIDAGWLTSVYQLTNELNPESPLSPEQINQVARVVMAAAAGLYPEDVDGRAFFLEDWLMPEESSDPAERQVLQMVISGMVCSLHLPEWWPESAARLPNYGAAQYDAARTALHEWPGMRRIIGTTHRFLSTLYGRLSIHQRQRLGPFARPALAIRGMGVAVFLVVAGLAAHSAKEVKPPSA